MNAFVSGGFEKGWKDGSAPTTAATTALLGNRWSLPEVPALTPLVDNYTPGGGIGGILRKGVQP